MNQAGRLRVAALLVIVGAFRGLAAPPDRPSRPADKGCRWERFSDLRLGLEAWVQRCDFGFRKVDFLATGSSLAVRFSDGGAADPVVDVFDLLPRETARAGIQRVFAAHTDRKLVQRCVLAPFRRALTPRRDVERYTFVPDAAYQKELDRSRDPNEVGDPPCGEWGDAPDGIQYFESQPATGARRILFVRVGQDTPLFDENTLYIVPPRAR